MFEYNNIADDIIAIRKKRPLLHIITNFVSMNFVANAVLAVGASPFMALAPEETEEIASKADALVLNMGTPTSAGLQAMRNAAAGASVNNVPIILDPVGIGSSNFREKACKKLLETVRPEVIKGNWNEIGALIGKNASIGVDCFSSKNLEISSDFKSAVCRYADIIVISGENDIVLSADRKEVIHGGHHLMSNVTGMGCAASAVIAAFLSVNPDGFSASTNAMKLMSAVGDEAAKTSKGLGDFAVKFLDILSNTHGF